MHYRTLGHSTLTVSALDLGVSVLEPAGAGVVSP